jgi:hypothetical protein
LIIQGFNLTDGAGNVAAVINLYPNLVSSTWNIQMKVRGTGAGASATYTIYYYAIQ